MLGRGWGMGVQNATNFSTSCWNPYWICIGFGTAFFNWPLEFSQRYPRLNSVYQVSLWASLIVQLVKNLPAMQEIPVQFLSQKIPWRRNRLPTPIFLLGEFHRQRRLQSMGSQRVGHDWATFTFTFFSSVSMGYKGLFLPCLPSSWTPQRWLSVLDLKRISLASNRH